MKNFTFILATVLTSLFVSTPKLSSFAADCSQSPDFSPDESSVLCWLKKDQIQSLKSQLNSARINVWNWGQRRSLKTDIPLQLLTTVPNADLHSSKLVPINDNQTIGYLGVTWINNDFAKKAQQAIDNNNGILKLEFNTWVTPVTQTQPFCNTCKGSLLNPNVPEIIKLRLRLTQYLGLILENSNQTHFVEIIAKKSDVFRPCLDKEIDDNQCKTPPTEKDRQKIIEDNPSLISRKYPWTTLGYTYDWGVKTSNVGASEYVIRPGATVFIKSVRKTRDFCQR